MPTALDRRQTEILPMTPEQILEATQWVITEGLKATPETEIIKGLSELLLAAGVPLLRVNVSQPTLHPIIGGHNFIWSRGAEAAVEESWERSVAQAGENYARTPFGHMSQTGAQELRCQGENCDWRTRFPMVEQFFAEGATDYFVKRIDFGEAHRLGPAQAVLVSWLTDSPGGFNDHQIELIKKLTQPLALATKEASTYRIAHTVISTYLGSDAGRRVLSGAIVRGTGESIRAAIWFCDLQGFTRLSDSVPRDQLLAMLDDYFEAMVTEVHEESGQVLKFMGDGVLAIFDLEDDVASCAAALNAAKNMNRRVRKLTEKRRLEGLPVTGFRLALHLGNVTYGNIGARDRLDFTVVGPAVNEASRIESMCRALEQDLLISSAFAEAAGPARDRLVSLGRYALRGVRRPQELFTFYSEED